MRVSLPKNVYTQINTDSTAFLIQNLSTYNLFIVASDTQPSPATLHDFDLSAGEGISNSHVEAIFWGKPSSAVTISIGVVEG